MAFVFVIIAILCAVLIFAGLRVAQEYQRSVVFRLGRYRHLRGPGVFWIVPAGIDRAVIVDIRTRTVSAEQQETITRDSVTIKVNAVLWYHVTDAALVSVRPCSFISLEDDWCQIRCWGGPDARDGLPWRPYHPFRNATIGSTPAARRAGIADASSAARPSISAASASMIGSHG